MEIFSKQEKEDTDKIINYFLATLFFIGIFFSYYYDTWTIATGVGGLSLTAFYITKAALPDSNLY